MLTFVAAIHLAIAIFLVIFILLQDSKGGAMGVLGGGSSNSVFGSTGAGNFLVKVTTWTAIIFSVTCIYLAYNSGSNKGSVLDNYTAAEKPAETIAPVETENEAAESEAPAADAPAKTESPAESDKK